MHKLLSCTRAGLTLVALLAVAAVGCKAKLDRSGADGSARAAGTDLQRAYRLVTAFLTDKAPNRKLPGGETLLAVDRVQQVHIAEKKARGVIVKGQARVFVRTSLGKDVIRVKPLKCWLLKKGATLYVSECTIDGYPVATKFMSQQLNEPDPRHRSVGEPGHMDWSVGVPACDRYMRFLRCYTSKLPEQSQVATRKALSKSLQAFRKMAGNPATRASLVKTCEMAMAAMRKAIDKVPKFWDCLPER